MRLRGWVLAGGLIGAAWAWRSSRHRADLAGKVVLVTGGSRGLGLLLAREFSAVGAQVVICARHADGLARARAWLAGEGADVDTVVCDVSDRAAVERVVAEIQRTKGSIDVLVNNAGIIQVGPVTSMTADDFADILGVNLLGTVYTTLAVLPEMRRRREGRIVNITSIGGKVAVPHLLPYDTAKHAAVGFSEGLAAELAGEGVHVITIVPGLMRTGSHVQALFKGNARAESRWFSLGATLPAVSMDAERAARQIVAAARRGDRVRTLSLPAIALAAVHGVAPGMTIGALGLARRLLLPRDDVGVTSATPGLALEPLQASWVRAVTRLGRVAAARFRQYPGSRPA